MTVPGGVSRTAREVPVPRLHLVTNRHLCAEMLLGPVVAQAARGGIGAVQLREKDLDRAALAEQAQTLRRVLGDIPLIVNGDIAVASAVGAAGVHLPATAATAATARAALGPTALIGRSVHSVVEAAEAEVEGVDYLFLGTIFATESKPGRSPAGLSLVTAVSREVGIPVIAIGGIDETNIAATLAAGAWGVAVMSGVLRAPNPMGAVVRMRAIIEREAG